MMWEQHGKHQYRKEGNYEYMIKKEGNYKKLRRHLQDDRWEHLGTYATLKDAQEE